MSLPINNEVESRDRRKLDERVRRLAKETSAVTSAALYRWKRKGNR